MKSPTTTRDLLGSASQASITRRCLVRYAHVRQGGSRNGLLKWTFMISTLWSRTLQCDGFSTAAWPLQYGSGTVRTSPFRRIAMPMPVVPTVGSRCPCGSTLATAIAVSGVSSCRAAISTSLRTRSSANAAPLARPPQRLAERILRGRWAVLFKGPHWRVESEAIGVKRAAGPSAPGGVRGYPTLLTSITAVTECDHCDGSDGVRMIGTDFRY